MAWLLAGVVSARAQNVTVQVLASDPKAYTLTVKGAGLPAPGKDGTEVLQVTVGDAEVGYAGHSIQGELGKSEGQWRLDNIWPADPVVIAAAADATAQLHRDTVELGRKAVRGVGDTLPAFALYNEHGDVVRSDQFRGRRLVINFIFTRCANPDMCPANTQRMVELQKQAKAAKLDDVTFVTITIDPEHDTPGALRQYADAYGLDLANFQLLTGPADEMSETLQQFGILTKEENGTLTHTFATLIVSPEGRITYRKDSDLWSVDEFLDRLKPPAPAAKPTGS
jgi:protein SCO1/2